MKCEIDIARRINSWQGIDQPITPDMVEALVWTMSKDKGLWFDFTNLVMEETEEFGRQINSCLRAEGDD